MFSQEEACGNGNSELAVLDPLNPWHTLQAKPVQRLADLIGEGTGGALHCPLLSYAKLAPHLLDTNSAPLSFQGNF